MVLGVLAGVTSLAYGGPTDWLFKCIKAKDSILVHSAKEVLLVNNLICCSNTPFCLSTNIAVCEL